MSSAGVSVAAMGPLDSALRWFGHQRWIRYGLRDRLLRWLRDPERVQGTFEVPFAGYIYPGRLERWIDWMTFYYGGYELDELELMRALLKGRNEPIALDIGANVGHHTLYLASFCAAVHAFEPFAGVADSLDDKVRRNGLKQVHLHRVGLGDQDEDREFFAPRGMNTGTGSFVATHESSNNESVGALQLVHADSYIGRLTLPRIDLVKIDVEGFELPLLRGLKQTLIRHRPIVMLELSDSVRLALATREVFMSLFPDGYEVQVVHSRRHRLGLFGCTGCRLSALTWSQLPMPGGYVNLLLRPAAESRQAA